MKRLFSWIIFLLYIVSTITFSQWKQTKGPYGGDVRALTTQGSLIFAGTDYAGIFVSSDSGVSWQTANNGIGFADISALYHNDNYVFASSQEKGVFRSSNNGSSWQLANSGLSDYRISLFIRAGKWLFASLSYGGVYRTSNNGTSWSPVKSGISEISSTFLSVCDTTLFTGSDWNGMFRSTNYGSSWSKLTVVSEDNAVHCVHSIGSRVFTSTDYGVYYSTDNGSVWHLPDSLSATFYVTCLSSIDTLLYAGVGASLQVSNNYGIGWQTLMFNEPPGYLYTLEAQGSILYTGSEAGVFRMRTKDTLVSSNTGIIASSIQHLYTLGNNILADAGSNGVFLTSDNGNNWNKLYLGPEPYVMYDLVRFGQSCFLSTMLGLSVSRDDGATWQSDSSILRTKRIFYLTVSDSTIVAFASDDIYCSNDTGRTWLPQNASYPDYIFKDFLAFNGYLFLCTWHNELMRSSDYGVTWATASTGINSQALKMMTVLDSTLFVGTSDYGIFRSTDCGMNWTTCNTGIATLGVKSISTIDQVLFASSGYDSIYMSANRGDTWQPINTGLGSITTLSIAKNDSFFFAGTEGRGIWKRPVTDIVTDVQEKAKGIPHSFSLEQNFPNPFNPTTMIRYNVPTLSTISIKIYNLLGEEISVLVDAVQSPGEHTVEWNPIDLPSGIYFCRLIAATAGAPDKVVILTKKMLYVR